MIETIKNFFVWIWNNIKQSFGWFIGAFNWVLGVIVAFILTPIQWLIEGIRTTLVYIGTMLDTFTGQISQMGAMTNLNSGWNKTMYYGEILNNVFPIWLLIGALGVMFSIWVFAVVVRIVLRLFPMSNVALGN
jgi:hypothetical protein